MEETSYFMSLPDELQIKIFRELSIKDLLKSTMVCLKWNKLIFDGSLWTTIDCTPFYKTITTKFILKLIISSSKFLKTANFRGCIQLTGHGLRTLSQCCPNLEVLILKDSRNISSSSLQYLMQHTTQLKELDLSCLDAVKTSTFTECQFSQLVKLNLNWCKNMTGPGLLPIFQSSGESLQYLNLNGCRQLDDSVMEAMGIHLKHITHLSLISCHSITDTGIFNFVKTYPHQLTHVNLSNCTRLTDTALRYISNYTTHITHLDLAGCILLTDEGIQYLAPRLNLTHLDLEDLHHLTNTSIQSIAQYQTKLQRLCLSNCVHISDDAVTHLILQGKCHQLQHIELDNCSITDVVLDTIANYLLKHEQQQDIREIHLEVLDCSHVTEEGVQEALHKASPMLSIKSFYSFQYNNTSTTLLEEPHPYQSTRYSTISSGRRNNNIQHNNEVTSCIIL